MKLNKYMYEIIESGSNSNGEWIKFANGIMICTKQNRGHIDINLTGGGLYYNAVNLGTSPQNFIEPPKVYASSFANSVSWYWLGSNTGLPSVSNLGTITLFRMTSINVEYIINVLAIGRWK